MIKNLRQYNAILLYELVNSPRSQRLHLNQNKLPKIALIYQKTSFANSVKFVTLGKRITSTRKCLIIQRKKNQKC